MYDVLVESEELKERKCFNPEWKWKRYLKLDETRTKTKVSFFFNSREHFYRLPVYGPPILVNGLPAFGKWTLPPGSPPGTAPAPSGTQPGGPSTPIFCQSSILPYKKDIFIGDTQPFQQFMLLSEINAETKPWLDAKHEVISRVSYQPTIIYLPIYLLTYLPTRINR